MTKRLAGALFAVLFVLQGGLPAMAQDDFKDEIRQMLDDGIRLYNRGMLLHSTAEKEGTAEAREEARAKFREAYTKFEQALQKSDQDPDQRGQANLVYAFLERAGKERVASMINSPDPQMRDIGNRLFRIAQPGEPLREGKKIVLAYVDDLASEDFEIYRNAHWHLKNYGSWACRFLMPALADETQDRFRSRVMLLMKEMGADATLPLIEALESENSFLKQTASIVLGNIRDDRAVAALKRAYENANEKPEVRKYAHEALQKITGKPSSEWKKAADYYYNLAEKYYYGDSGVIFNWQRYYLIWTWDSENDRLLERRCARFVFNEQLAEEALFDLLALDPDYRNARGESAWALLVMNEFQQALEAEAAVRASISALKNDEITTDGLVGILRGIEGMSADRISTLSDEIQNAGDHSAIQALLMKYFSFSARIIRSNILAVVPGRQFIYEALERSLKDENPLVAKACIQAIAEMGKAADLPSDTRRGTDTSSGTSSSMGYPLVEALTSPDKRVRYAAAETMVKLNPQQVRLGMELVIPNLVDALGEQGVRVALVIYDVQTEADQNFINRFKKSLLNLNVFPVIAKSGSEGIIKAKKFPTEDVIIIQKKIAGQIYFQETATRKREKESVLRALTRDVRTRNIPRIILADDGKSMTEAQTQFQDNTPWYIKKDTHKLDLRELLSTIFDQPEAKKDSKDRADHLAESAAKTLASISTTDTLYPYLDAVEALIRTVSPKVLREDFIRIPAARALGVYGDQRAIDVLAKVLNAKDGGFAGKQKPLRLQCARSLSQVFLATGATPNKQVFDILLDNAVSDGDYHIEFASGEALGNSNLTVEQRREVVQKRRLKRDWYSADDE